MRLPAALLSTFSCCLAFAAASSASTSIAAPQRESASFPYRSTMALAGKALYRYRTLVTFTGVNGLEPLDNLTVDSAGNLYGTTSNGFHREGTLFKLDTSGRFATLYNFNTNVTEPGADAVMDSAGNLYGTAMEGLGSFGNGGIYKLGSNGVETVLHAFSGGADGDLSFSNLVFGPNGDLYGTTSLGGNTGGKCGPSGCGVVFKVSTGGNYSVVHAFDYADGAQPAAGVMFDAQRNLYGTTQFGGKTGYGTVYEIGTSGKETVLYDFRNGADGGQPTSSLVTDSQGNLYGTTSAGGKKIQACNVGPTTGCGVVFALSPSGQETTLHAFSSQPDGAQPLSGLLLDAHGNLYGTTREGGKSIYGGTVFAITTSGQNYTILHAFLPQNGEEPAGAVYMDTRGDLFGTTSAAGKGNGGTVYELIPQSRGAQ